jgi:hypothetical protein
MVSKILDITLNIDFTGNINLSSFVDKNMETDGKTNKRHNYEFVIIIRPLSEASYFVV